MKVDFIDLSASEFKAWKSEYKGLFVYLKETSVIGEGEDAATFAPGLYFGGESGWEFLTNTTDVASFNNLNTKIDTVDTKINTSVGEINNAISLAHTWKTVLPETDTQPTDDE